MSGPSAPSVIRSNSIGAPGPEPLMDTFTFTVTDTLSISLRTILPDGEPWFIAKDVCAVLGLDTDNVRRSLPERHVNTVKLTGLRGRDPLIVSGSAPHLDFGHGDRMLLST